MLVHLCLPLVNIRLRYLIIEITILNQNLAAGVVAVGVIKELGFVFLIAYPASGEVGRAVLVGLERLGVQQAVEAADSLDRVPGMHLLDARLQPSSQAAVC